MSSVSQELGMLPVYEHKGIFNVVDVQNKCHELMCLEWTEEVDRKPKLSTYREFKTEFKLEPYVKNYMPKHTRSLIAQFRFGILPLHIETGRLTNILDQETGVFRKLMVEELKCQLCNNGSVEDELHFLFECAVYEMVQNDFFDYCKGCNVNFDDMSHTAKLYFLMSHE